MKSPKSAWFWNSAAIAVAAAALAITVATAEGPASPPAFPATPAYATPHPRDWSFVEVGEIPVQSNGRIKPLDSVARETVLFITGSRSLPGWNPVDLFLSWIAYPEYWSQQPIIKITNLELLKQLLLEPGQPRFAPRDLLSNSVLAQYAREIESQRPGVPPLQVVKSVNSQPSPREQELKRVLDRLALFRATAAGKVLTLVPRSPNAEDAWSSITDGNPMQNPVQKAFLDTMRAYYHEQNEDFLSQSRMTATLVKAAAPSWTARNDRALKAESLYNRARPFRTAYVLYLIAGLLWMGAIMFSTKVRPDLPSRKNKFFAWSGTVALTAAVLSHILGFAFRCYVSGRPPVSNMYESIVWVGFGAVAFSLIIFWMHRQVVLLAVGSIVGAFTLMAADAAPAVMDPSIHTLVPVLRSNYWLTIHVLTITLGYAAFALSMGISDTTLYQYLKGALGKSDTGTVNAQTLRLNQLSYRAMQFGVVLLAAGTILGGVWADYSWGRFWGWDPKETWALIALLTYLAILHGRFAGWVSSFGFAVWGVLAFLSVLMCWYGVNFVLGVGLHSYGFSTGGTAWVVGFCALQLAYVAWVVAQRRGAKASTTKP